MHAWQVYRALKLVSSQQAGHNNAGAAMNCNQEQCVNPKQDQTCHVNGKTAEAQLHSSQIASDAQSGGPKPHQNSGSTSLPEEKQKAVNNSEVQERARIAVHRGRSDVPVLVSGAGHDGLAMANLTPVRCCTHICIRPDMATPTLSYEF